MARISTYSIDTTPSGDDLLIGSQANENNKTSNYRIDSIIQSIQSQAINSIPKVVNVVLTEGESMSDSLAEINITVDVGDTPVIFQFFKPTNVSGAVQSTLEYAKIVYLFPLGNGVYEPVSDSLEFKDLILLNASKPSQEDISSLGLTVTIDLGDITGTTVSEEVNSLVPSVNLTDPDTNYLFTYIQDSVSYFTLFVGTNGVYGANDTQSTDSDFAEFTNSETLAFEEDRNIKGSIVTVNTASDYYDNDADEIDAVVAAVNALPKFEVNQDFYGVISAQNFRVPTTSVAYNCLYIITRGKGIYGTGGTQLTNSKSDIIKIYDGFRNLDLSNYDNTVSQFITLDDVPSVSIPTDVSVFNNDANYADENYVDSSVSYRGTYGNKDDLSNITFPESGDYAFVLIKAINVLQKWIYSDNKFNLISAKENYFSFNTNFSVDYRYHNSVIEAKDFVDTITLNNPTDGLSYIIKNNTPANITLSSVSNLTETVLEPNQIASFIYNDSSNRYDVTLSKSSQGVDVGTYYYGNSATTQTSYVADSSTTFLVDGVSPDTTKRIVSGKTDFFNTSTGDLDFTGLSIGDIINIEIEIEATNVTANNELLVTLVTGIGSTSSKDYRLGRIVMNTVDDYKLVASRRIPLKRTAEIVFPGTIKFQFSENTDAILKSVFIEVITK